MFKDSQGIRHSDVYEANSKDEVFAALRKKGIRPIRVENPLPTPITPLRIAVITVGVCLCVAVGTVLCLLKRGREVPLAPYNPETYAMFTNIQHRATELMDWKSKHCAALNFANAEDLKRIQSAEDLTLMFEEIRRSQKTVQNTKGYLRDVFRDICDVFPESCVRERSELKTRYGELMDELDRDEDRLLTATKAIRLLDANREKWSLRERQIVFSDAAIEKDFAFLRRVLEEGDSRWNRDFVASGVGKNEK